ncbi:hypothetical protein AABM17_41 [Neisseria musculi]|uniref:Uncharacterized protein n=1 Tax=Neisseria musculi TaxID=1815583 RepID=A0A7H1MF56_9NEIS|nr:hypothetical protein H7A79_0041 [Neisseria musculi]
MVKKQPMLICRLTLRRFGGLLFVHFSIENSKKIRYNPTEFIFKPAFPHKAFKDRPICQTLNNKLKKLLPNNWV